MLDGIYPKVPAVKQLAILNRDCLEFVENFLSVSCEESSKEQESKGIVVAVTENSNYVYHMLSVANAATTMTMETTIKIYMPKRIWRS